MAGSDAEALARARAGDTDGFRILVERHAGAVFRLAYRMTGNEHDAEDVVQETFLKAFRRLHQFEERASVSSWLYRIAANCGYDVLRSRRRREDGRAPDPAEGDGAAASLPATDPTPDRLVFSAELRRRVGVAMGRMTSLERAAFTLRHLEGMSIGEIGAALGLETSAAKQSVFRAVRKAREALAPLSGASS
jgi:RNA polymerase sigma-70 factor, ECF subfamily